MVPTLRKIYLLFKIDYKDLYLLTNSLNLNELMLRENGKIDHYARR